MYRVDLDTSTLLQLRRRRVFAVLGLALLSLSVSLEALPSGTISPNTIYLSFDMY
jgi:hypothetical protein